MIAEGGKAVYGANIGILMLEARFPRIPGDMGNALSWPFPVHYRVVRGASPDRVVRRRAEGLLDAFIEAGRELVADGADGITTNCGFLSLYQVLPLPLAELVDTLTALPCLFGYDANYAIVVVQRFLKGYLLVVHFRADCTKHRAPQRILFPDSLLQVLIETLF